MNFIVEHIGLIVILLITFAFLAVIFAAGYNDKPKADS